MKVECININIKSSNLPNETEIYVKECFRNKECIDLDLKKIYVVYGIMHSRAALWYCVIRDEDIGFPYWYPAKFFAVRENSIPDNWNFFESSILEGREKISEYLITFEAWASDPGFYDKLFDEDPRTITEFMRQKKYIDDFSK